MADLRDESLMLAAGRGDGGALALLFYRHRDGALAFAVRLLGNAEDAADVVQDAFRYLHRTAGRYAPAAKFTTYLFRIVKHQCIDILRRRGRWKLQSLDPTRDYRGADHLPSPALEGEELRERVKEALAELPGPAREVVLLRVVHGLSYSEIAVSAGLPLGTVKSRLHAGLEQLRFAIRRRRLLD
jgi:RNA polymerase sigma-70 factor (ECF subfamily)